jgi:hypothetical protein
MIRFFSIIFLILFVVDISAQLKPESFNLPSDKNYFSKTTSSTPTSNSILDIISIGDTVWLGTSRGVSVSFDRGENWTNFYGTSPFGDDNISALGYENGTIWVATATSVEGTGGGTVPKGTGLKYTTDNGLTWTSIPQPVDHPDSTTVRYGDNILQALPVTVGEQNLTYDIAFTPNTIWITSFAGGLRKSTNMGQSWQRVVLPPDNLSSINPGDSLDFCLSPVGGSFCENGNYNHRAFSVISTDATTLYVGTADGINKSTDNGISWVKFNHQNQDEPISGNFVTALGYNQSNNTVWAATWKANDPDEYYGVSSSDNGGDSWSIYLNEERAHNFGFKGNNSIAATDNGAFRTSNQGETWILPTSIIDTISDPTTKVYLHTIIYYSAASQGSDVWLGSDDGLAKITETSFWVGNWKLYFASQPLSSGNETYCYPNPFSPRQEKLKIKYSTGGVEASVTIRIFNFSMDYIKTIIQNVPRNRTLETGSPPEFWDGTDENGNLLPNGVYFYSVEIDDNDPIFGKIIYLQ